MTFFDVMLTPSVLTKFKFLWMLGMFPAEDKIAHNIPCLVTLCFTTHEKKFKTFDPGSITLVLKLRNFFTKSISTFLSMCAKPR